jgi:DNA-3-methyladenine glycosylase II
MSQSGARKSVQAPRAPARRKASFELELPGPLDPVASLEMFRRSGDDLLDRWDGRTLLRTIAIDGRMVAFATAFAGTRARPAVRVTMDDGECAEGVRVAVRATFVPPPRHFAQLRRADPFLANLQARYPGFRAVLQLNLLGALVRCISAQQVNLRWASETRRRLAQRFGDRHEVDGSIVYSLNAERLAGAAPAEIRALQFTNRKAEYIVAVAQAVASNRISLARLAVLSDAAVIDELVALRGIGLWTAEWILARTLGRPRVVAGDLGVRKAIGIAYRKGAMPSEDDVRELTAHWRLSAAHAQALLLHALGERELEALAAATVQT